MLLDLESSHFYHLSSPSFILFKESHHVFRPRSESKFFFFSWFCQVSFNFEMFLLRFFFWFVSVFAMRIFVRSWYWLVVVKMLVSVLIFMIMLLEYICDIINISNLKSILKCKMKHNITNMFKKYDNEK